MDIVDNIVKEISRLNELGKYNLIEQLLDKRILDVENILSQYVKKKQYEIDSINAELQKAYLHCGLSEPVRMKFLKSRKIIE
jgi:uncharacterized protein YqgQ